MSAFFFNCKVVVVNDLHRDFELVELSLHQLLRAQSYELQVVFRGPRLHYLFAFFNVLLFALFHNLPKFIGKHITPLMKLFFCMSIFSEIWIVVSKLIEVSNKSVEQFLFVVASLQVNQEFLLHTSFGFIRDFSVFANVTEDSLHLRFVIMAEVLP